MERKPTFLEGFTSIDRKFPWSFLGFLFGVIFFFVGLYLAVFYTKSPGVRFEIISESPVYDIRENLTKLEVLFDGENIRQKHEALSLVSIRIVNDGNANLSKSAFDERALPLLTIPDSKIITIEALSYSNNYLKEFGKVLQVGSNQAAIQPVILDQGDSFAFRLLILHKDGQMPQVQVEGKIEGIKDLEVVKAALPENITFSQKAFAGDFLVQIARVAVYLFGGVVAIGGIAASMEAFNDWNAKRRRRNVVRLFKSRIDVELPQRVEAVLRHYEALGDDVIDISCGLLRDSDALKKAVRATTSLPRMKPMSAPESMPAFQEGGRILFREIHRPESVIIRTFLDEGIVTTSGGTILVDPQTLDFMNRFESFLMAFLPKKKRNRIKSNEVQIGGSDSSLADFSVEGTTKSSPSSHE